LKPLFRSNHILEKLYEERVNDDDEINITENHFNCFVGVDIDADNFNVKDVNEDIIDINPTVVEEVCDNSYESNVLFNKEFQSSTFILANAVAGVLGFYLNFASVWCVSATSATTYAIVGSVNKVPITILGFWLFQARMTFEGLIFVAFATLGGFLYAYSKLPKKK
jgi:hypothetical protein